MEQLGQQQNNNQQPESPEKRKLFIRLGAALATAAGVFALVPLFKSTRPQRSSTDGIKIRIDLSTIKEGESRTARWGNKPVFIRHRTDLEIAQANSVSLGDLLDPERDEDRVQNPKYLVVVGLCTHMGCVPEGQEQGDYRGDYGGWACSCHGAAYDTSGRVRQGPATKNLVVPPYRFISDTEIEIG